MERLTKKCTKCNIAKELDSFSNCKSFKDGKAYKCKKCYAQYKKENRGKFTQYETERYNRKKDEIREKANAKYIPHYNRVTPTIAVIRERKKAWKLKNPEAVTEYSARRRAAVRNQVPVNFNRKKVLAIYREAKERRLRGENVHVDHIVPLLGKTVRGLHSHENLRIIPAIENLRKGNRIEGLVINL